MIDDRNIWLGFQPIGMTLLATTVSPELAEVKQKEKGACNVETDLILQTAPSTFKRSMGSYVLELRVCLSSIADRTPSPAIYLINIAKSLGSKSNQTFKDILDHSKN